MLGKVLGIGRRGVYRRSSQVTLCVCGGGGVLVFFAKYSISGKWRRKGLPVAEARKGTVISPLG